MTAVRFSRTILLASMALAAGGPPISAQTAPRAGDRVRVYLSGSDTPVEARLVRMDQAQVVFLTEGLERRAPFDGTTRVEVARSRSHGRTGALVGALAGAATGFAASLGEEPSCSGWACGGVYNADDARIAAIVGGVLIGAALGALLGITIRTEIWEPVGPGAIPPIGPAPLDPRGRAFPALSIGVKLPR